MARWQPKSDIGPNERIGRRLFDEPRLFGASDQNPFDGLDLRNFEESRSREFSVDRVGATGADKKVLKYVLRRARAAAKSFHVPRTFHGWLIVPAKTLEKGFASTRWQLHSSPDPGPSANGEILPWSDDNLRQNLYHAHIMMPQGLDYATFALYAREVFKTGLVWVDPEAGPSTGSDSSDQRLKWWVRLRNAIRRI